MFGSKCRRLDLSWSPIRWTTGLRLCSRARRCCSWADIAVGVAGRSRCEAETPDGTTWREAVAPSVRDNPAIASAWARGQVRRLEDRYAAGLGDHSALEKTIVATSLRFGVLCRFTAYVAVDRREVVNEGGEVHQVTQPVEMPAGWAIG